MGATGGTRAGGATETTENPRGSKVGYPCLEAPPPCLEAGALRLYMTLYAHAGANAKVPR